MSACRSIFTVACAALALVSAARLPAAPGEPKLSDVVKGMGRYIEGYGGGLAVLVGVERYEQRQASPEAERSLVSEIAFVPVRRDWLVYRDVLEVDGRRVSDRSDRLERLLIDSPETGAEQARRIADESARYNLGPVRRNLNTPTMCLFALRPENLDRFKFRRVDRTPAGGQEAWTIHFEEKERPTIVRTPEGRSLPMRGSVRLRLADAAVIETLLEVEFPADEVPWRATIAVKYDDNVRLKMLLPSTMDETYQQARNSRAAAGITCHAVYSDFKRFETSGRLIIPR